jgi:DNA modification methylase
MRASNPIRIGSASLYSGDALAMYDVWDAPTCIISDGPYGLGKFPGEANTTDGLADWYAPHVAEWAKRSGPDTTLWFWNSELGWATVHPILEKNGWQYEECCVWDKGIAHIAGNCNSKTIRGIPVVTEVTVRYNRRATLRGATSKPMPIKEWVKAEWLRSGLPMYLANAACGVKNAASRKYLTEDWRWYFPPPEAIVGMASYCQRHGLKTNRPYFTLDGRNPPSASEWERMRTKWNHVHGLTNVWREPPVHGSERYRAKHGTGYLHANQKPLSLMERQILACTDPRDVMWEPFGGLCSASVAAVRHGRMSYAAEINADFAQAATARLEAEIGGIFRDGRNEVARRYGT